MGWRNVWQRMLRQLAEKEGFKLQVRFALYYADQYISWFVNSTDNCVGVLTNNFGLLTLATRKVFDIDSINLDKMHVDEWSSVGMLKAIGLEQSLLSVFVALIETEFIQQGELSALYNVIAKSEQYPCCQYQSSLCPFNESCEHGPHVRSKGGCHRGPSEPNDQSMDLKAELAQRPSL